MHSWRDCRDKGHSQGLEVAKEVSPITPIQLTYLDWAEVRWIVENYSSYYKLIKWWFQYQLPPLPQIKKSPSAR
jgi:hypothetical protein